MGDCDGPQRRKGGKSLSGGGFVFVNRHAVSQVEAGCCFGQIRAPGACPRRTNPKFSHREARPGEQENRSRAGRLTRKPARDVFPYCPSIRMLQATVAQAAVRMDEPELIRAAQRGDQRAFEQLVRTYDQNVLRLALNLLRSPEDANDIYQEAFLRVYKNLHTFRFDCSFHTWLYRIVTNLCLDALRKRRVRREENTVVETSDGYLDRMDTLEEGRADGDPQLQLLSGQLRGRIQQGLSDLTPRQRTVFEMRHYQGLRLRAIGEILGTSAEAAKNCLFRATQKMRAALGDFV